MNFENAYIAIDVQECDKLLNIAVVKNGHLTFINCDWKYFSFDLSTRILLRPKGYS